MKEAEKKIEWTDELVATFSMIYRRDLDIFKGCISIGEKLQAFKKENNIR